MRDRLQGRALHHFCFLFSFAMDTISSAKFGPPVTDQRKEVNMASTKRHAAAGHSQVTDDDIRPNNPLQSDFNANETRSMDSDERYLVRLIRR